MRNNWLFLWIICIFLFLSYVCMPVSWPSGSFWKRLPSWAEWVLLGSAVASEPKLCRISSPLLLEPYFPWQTGSGVLALGIEFIFAFTNCPFPLFSDLLFLPEKVLFYKNMGFEKQNGAKAGGVWMASAVHIRPLRWHPSEYPHCFLGGLSSWQPVAQFSSTE